MSFHSLIQSLHKYSQIFLTTHIHPDGDGLGSMFALSRALRKMGKKCFCILEEPLLERYHFLKGEEILFHLQSSQDIPKSLFSLNPDQDLLIVCDTHLPSMLGNQFQTLLGDFSQIIYLDHHPLLSKHTKQQSESIIHDPSYAATGEMMGEIINLLGIELDEHMATCLYTAILIDTSSFRYPKVTGRTHRLIGQLLDAGVMSPIAYNQIYGTSNPRHLLCLGEVLQTIELSEDNRIISMWASQENLQRHQVKWQETLGFINHLLICQDQSIGVMFWELEEQLTKVSFRSIASHVNVGLIASSLGGGGHPHSASVILSKTLHQSRIFILNEIAHKLAQTQQLLTAKDPA